MLPPQKQGAWGDQQPDSAEGMTTSLRVLTVLQLAGLHSAGRSPRVLVVAQSQLVHSNLTELGDTMFPRLVV